MDFAEVYDFMVLDIINSNNLNVKESLQGSMRC